MIQIQINLKGYFKIAPYELEVVNIKRTHITTLIFVFVLFQYLEFGNKIVFILNWSLKVSCN